MILPSGPGVPIRRLAERDERGRIPEVSPGAGRDDSRVEK